MKTNRRNFLKTSLLAAATTSWTAKSWSQVKGANDRIHVGVVGFNGRGKSHIGGFSALDKYGVKVDALCDVDSRVLEQGVESFKRKDQTVRPFKDIRDLLEAPDVDVISIATPNHWHSLAAIWAIQAGKDVYVEKPVSHNVWEGRKLVEAARKYNRIVQTGTQARSSFAIQQAVEFVQSGKLGKVRVARGLCYKPRKSLGLAGGAQKVPDNIDYNLWSGPAPLVPPTRNAKYGPIHYDWHWFWNYGNGDLGNQGIHQMDIARWFLGEQHLSPAVMSLGGRLGYDDDGETPNTQLVYHGYPTAPLIFEVRGLPRNQEEASQGGKYQMDDYKGASIGVVVECEGGHVLVTSSYNSAVARDEKGREIETWKGSSDHFENFIGAVLSRKVSDLNADIWQGHVSSALCHTGNISYRLGAGKKPEAVKEELDGDKLLREATERMFAHLEANGVSLDSAKVNIGPMLRMDPKTEKFYGNVEADALLTREYREPFVVPEHV